MQRKNLETAAANYSYLRGLFFIPLGMLFILAALANWEVGPLRHIWAFPVAAVLVGVTCLPIAHYYNENYGRVSLSTSQQVRGAVAVLIGLAVMVGGSSLMRSQADWSLDLPVNAIAVSFAVIMLITALWSGATGKKMDPVELAVLAVGCSFLLGPVRRQLRLVSDELLFGIRPDPLAAAGSLASGIGGDPADALDAVRASLVLPYAALTSPVGCGQAIKPFGPVAPLGEAPGS